MAVSFANDLAPTLFKYRGQMAWRFDLANYNDVRANAAIISEFISGPQPMMPPPPFDPFPQTFIDAFTTWMNTGYPP